MTCFCHKVVLFFFFFNFYFFLFIYLFLAVLGLRFCARALSSCGKRGPLFIAVHGPLTIAASPVGSTGSRRAGSRRAGSRRAGSAAVAQQPWLTGLATPRHVGSSRTRARTRVPCIGRQIPNHCATREARHKAVLLKYQMIKKS